MADVKTRAYYAPYDNDYYVPDAEGAKRTGKNENWRDIEKGFYLVQAKNDEQDSQFAAIEAKDEEQDGRLDAIEAKDEEQDGRLDAIEAVNTQQNLDIQTNRTNITGLDTRLTSAESLLSVVSQTSVENSAAIAQLQTDQQTLSGRLDTTNAQLADNSTRLTRAENNITTLQSDAAQASQDITALQGRATAAEGDIDTLDTEVAAIQGDIAALEDQAVIRLQATFDRQTETVTFTDPAAAYDALTSGHNAVIDLLVDNSYISIYTKDINNSTNETYRFMHAETGVDAGGNGYTGTDAITITLDTVNEAISSVAWTQVYNVTKKYVDDAISNIPFKRSILTNIFTVDLPMPSNPESWSYKNNITILNQSTDLTSDATLTGEFIPVFIPVKNESFPSVAGAIFSRNDAINAVNIVNNRLSVQNITGIMLYYRPSGASSEQTISLKYRFALLEV